MLEKKAQTLSWMTERAAMNILVLQHSMSGVCASSSWRWALDVLSRFIRFVSVCKLSLAVISFYIHVSFISHVA